MEEEDGEGGANQHQLIGEILGHQLLEQMVTAPTLKL